MILDNVNCRDVNDLQIAIMQMVDRWVHEVKTPVPYKEILFEMKKAGVKNFTTVNALSALLKKGYIRRSVSTVFMDARGNIVQTATNQTFYVQLKRV